MGIIAKYKFNNTLADLLPEFNSEFTSDLYTVTDEVNGNVTTRTIESDSLPTLMRFGRVWVSGEFAANNRTDSLLEVLDMNASGLTSCHSMFRYNTNLTSISCEWDTSNVTEMSNMFAYCTNLTSLDVSNWDTSKVTSMYGTFSSCTNLTSLDVSNFNTNKVTTMHYMFYGCNNLTSLDLSNFDTSEVTSMQGMFTYCFKLTSLDVSNFNTSNVTTMYSMFYGCKSLTSLDVSNWDTNNVTTMNGMFYGCNNLTTLDVGNWNTSNVTDMYQMFRDCSSLVSLDVSRFDTSKVTTMYCMFYNCRNLAELDVSNWNTSNVESMYSMFCNCIRLLFLDISKWDTSKNVNIDYMFSGYNYDMNLVSLDINNFNIDNINRDYSHLFERMPYLKYLKCKNTNVLNTLLPYLPTRTSDNQGTIICKSDITNLDTTSLQSKYWNILDEPTLIAKYVFDKSIYNNCIPEFNTEFEGYFIEDEVEEGSNEVTRTIESCGMLPTNLKFGYYTGGKLTREEAYSLINVEYINTSNMNSTYTYCMFSHCSNLTSLDVSNFDTSNVTTMYAMFYNCSNLTTLDLSNFNTSNVTTMRCMFYGCTNLTTLDVSNFNTSNVTTMREMFNICNNLTTLDVSNFNTSKVTDMSNMFNSCNNLTTLDLSNFNTSKVTDVSNMFNNTFLLTDISVLYMDKSSLQKLVDAIPTNSNKTLWYKDVNIDGITHGDNITLKKYMEGNVEIVLNSPLLEGDRIEVKDGKLCHYHKMEKVVLDGSENWQSPHNFFWIQKKYLPSPLKEREAKKDSVVFVDTLVHGYIDNNTANQISTNRLRLAIQDTSNGGTNIRIILKDIKDNDIDGLKQWLQANPTTIIYELEEPYYEDITPLQSSLALRTFEECNIQIITALPIKTKITYRTNITSAIVMEQELDTLDSGVSLSNLIEEEVNE